MKRTAGSESAMRVKNQILDFADQVGEAEAARKPPEPEQVELHLVAFHLGEEHYAIPIAAVREIVRVVGITRVPDSPPNIRGVMNLRGRILPVVELRTRLGLPALDPGPQARVVVVEVRGRVLGLLVDGVARVLRVSQGVVAQAPDEVRTAADHAVTGVARVNDQLLLLLELERLIQYQA